MSGFCSRPHLWNRRDVPRLLGWSGWGHGRADVTEAPYLVFSSRLCRSERLTDVVRGGMIPPNPDVYAAYARWSLLVDHEATPYRGVVSTLVESNGAPSNAEPDVPVPADEESAARALRQSLEAAVQASMGDARRVAVSTGGGLDSGVLLALAVHVARRAKKEVVAVALDFGGAGDDRPYLADLERELSCEVVRVPPERGADHVALLDGVDAAPFYCPTGPMEAAVMEHARAAGAERVLTGAGGDQLFDGRATDLASFLRRGHVLEGIRRAQTLRGFEQPRSPIVTWLVRPLLASLLPPSIRARRAGRSSGFVPAWAGPALEDLEARRRRQTTAMLEKCLPDLRPFEDRIFVAQRVQFAWLRHQQTLTSGIRRVDPFLRPDLVQRVRSLPREWLLHGGIRRGLLRAAVRDLIPASLARREDKASVEPALVRFLRAIGGRAALRPYASVDVLASLGVVDRARFAAAYEAFVDQPAHPAGWLGAWCVLALERFARTA
ncbi:MAG: asparagine synthase [Labilithrix sp.]|nr:asparagine synthase [Labilithrix sp.]MCW5813496.1 asparagine synthase [Labilithrix sp.]